MSLLETLRAQMLATSSDPARTRRQFAEQDARGLAATPPPKLAATMNQARAWSVDPSTPPAVRRKLARSVAAYDAARAARVKARAEAKQLRADHDALKSRIDALAAETRARREAEGKERRIAARRELERAGCFSTPNAIEQYLATGERRERPHYANSTAELYARAR